MDLLVNWITQIIIFLIIATIIDLLIPANKMKKYIQFIVGLILILIFLKPVLYIFNVDIKDALETSFTQSVQSNETENNMENLMKMQKSEIESSQDAYILEQMVVQLKDLAETPLENKFQTEITDIQFKFHSSEKTLEDLEEIIVYLAESKEEEGVVDEVKDIVIDTKKTPTEHEIDDNNKEIKKMLQEVWELDDINLTIIQEGGAS